VINIKDIKPGDTIELTFESVKLIRTATLNGPTINARLAVETMPRGTFVSIARLIADGWSITDHKPKVELPTEPGWYQAASFPISDPGWYPYVLDVDGVWRSYGDTGFKAMDDPDELATDGPLTRLVPEGSEREQAIQEVIDWIGSRRAVAAEITLLREAREHFGVQS